ncbi:hypothetical protein NQZ79_g2319 [Umbelopsis isabellina]|nr:hypothetical protein NQZ79_g2319 [Umbelopsis isabellina]
MATANSTVAPINIKTSTAASQALRALRSSSRAQELDSVNKLLDDFDHLYSLTEVDSSNRDWKRVVGVWNGNVSDVDPINVDTALNPSNDISNVATNFFDWDGDLPTSPTALGEIFALASIHRSCIWPAVADLCSICTSLAATHAFESVTTSVISSMICTLNVAIASKAEYVEAAESEKLLDLVTRWNTELEKFQWDGDTGQFLAPLNVNSFRMWIYENFPDCNQRGFDIELLMLIKPGRKEINSERNTILQERESIERGSIASTSSSTTGNKNTCIDENLVKTLMRARMEPTVTHFAEADTLDFIWSDPEEEDIIYDGESEDSDIEPDTGIFDSATEISGADVTESDWSEIN